MAKAWKVTGIRPGMPVGRAARRVLATRIAELWSYAPFLPDPERVEELHAMRIAAKRLRYSLEIFAPYLDPAAKALTEQVKDIQERLGQIHDADVLAPYLAERLSDLHRAEDAALLADFQAQRDDEARARFIHALLHQPRDARLPGVYALLGRTLARRQRLHADFLDEWRALTEAGLRDQLERLIWPDLTPSAPEDEDNA